TLTSERTAAIICASWLENLEGAYSRRPALIVSSWFRRSGAVGGLSDQHEFVPQPGRDQHFVLRRHDHTLDLRQPLDERHALLGAEEEHAGRQAVGHERAVGDYRHAAAQARGLAGGRVDDVVIPHAILHERPRVIT